MPDPAEAAVAPVETGMLGAGGHLLDPVVPVPYDLDARFPMDPFDFQMHAYTDADMGSFLGEMDQ